MIAAQPSARIAEIRDHVVRTRFLDGIAALEFATGVYLDERRGYRIPENHALRLAEQAARVEPLAQSVTA